MFDAAEHILERAILGRGVMHVVCSDNFQVKIVGDRKQAALDGSVTAYQMSLQFQEVVLAPE